MPESHDTRGRILVLGAGELGMALLRALVPLRQERRIGPVCVLLRPRAVSVHSAATDVRAQMRALGVDVVEADLATISVEALAATFSRFAQVICCTGFVGGPGTQRRITAAVLAAGIEHYVPWQFGVDYDVIGRGSGQQVWDEQLDVREMLRAQSAVRWTIVSTGMFTSFVFLPAFGLVDAQRERVHALGDWDNRLTVTGPEDIGRLTALVVAEPSAFADQVVHLAGDTFSYRRLAETLERVLGRPMERVLMTVPELRARAEADPGDAMAAYRLAFARPNGVAWPKQATLNARLGIATHDLEQAATAWARGPSRGSEDAR